MTEQKESQELTVPRAFVTRVTTNLKTPGEEPRSFQLGPLTLLVGPSGAGKTSVVDSICLALTGSSPTRGLGKAALNLKRAMPEKADALVATVELSTDETLVWSLGRDDAKAVWPFADGYPLQGSGVVVPAPGAIISAADALDLLLGYDKNRLLALLDAVPETEIVVQDVEKLASGLDRELLLRLEGVLPSDGEVISSAQLRQALKSVGSISSEFTRAVSACDALRSPGLSNSEAMELSALEDAHSRQAGADFVRQELARVEKQLESVTTEVTALPELIESAQPGHGRARAVVARTMDALSATIAYAEARGADTIRCPGCGDSRERESFAARGAQLAATLEKLDEPVREYLERLEHHMGEHTTLERSRLILSDLLTRYGSAEAVDVKRLVELRQRKDDAALAMSAGSKSASLTRAQKLLGLVEEALLDSAVKSLPAVADVVRRRMNRVLPRGREAYVAVDGRKVNIGQQMNKGPVIPCGALSGSERVVLSVAFAVALQAKRQTPVSLLVIDEVMFDRKTLKLVLTGLSRALEHDAGPTQVLVCAAEWSSKLPAGWIACEVAAEAEAPPEKSSAPEQPPQPIDGLVEGDSTGSASPAADAQTTESTGETSAAPPPDGSFLDDLL